MRRLALLLLALTLLAACDSEEPESAARQGERPKNAPPALAALHDQSSELLGGGLDAFRKRLRELRGYPVVVNRWASWCTPCRAEFPYFQRQALERGAKVAFLGLDIQDNDADAREFLRKFPIPFPSYRDPDLRISADLNAIPPPTTIFFDRRGEVAYMHQGAYLSEEKLVEDLERYAR